MQNLESNINKMFWYLLTQRRNFIPLLSIYFLTLPNTTINQIGIFMGIWSIMGFLFEIPSWYISDKIWHRKALIIAKVFNVLSTLFFILWWLALEFSFPLFILWSIFLTLSFSFTSGTVSAFIHDSLTALWKQDNFTEIFSKLRWKASLASIIMIVGFPFFTEINIILPFYIALVIDLTWLAISLSLKEVPKEKNIKKQSKSIKEIISESYHLHLLPFAIFSWAIWWIELWLSPFRSIYLESLGFPIIFIGTVMALSRFVWFIVWQYAHIIQNYFSFKWFLLLRMLVSVAPLFLIIIFQNPYVAWIIFALANWFKWWVVGITQDYTYKYYLSDTRYKATLSSIKSQVSFIIQIIAWFSTGYIISITNYQVWYFVVWTSLLIILGTTFPFIKTKQK